MVRQPTKKRATQTAAPDKKLYTFEVLIISGLMTKSFMKKNKVISRTIQLRGDQTLEDFHHAIFEAFDREDDHMYEFQIGGKGPMDPKARRYTLGGFDDEMEPEDQAAGKVERTTIGSLGLKVEDIFGYWFDFGDDWWHQINVVAIEEQTGRGKYPKVIKRTGASPPQYVEWDEEDEGEC